MSRPGETKGIANSTRKDTKDAPREAKTTSASSGLSPVLVLMALVVVLVLVVGVVAVVVVAIISNFETVQFASVCGSTVRRICRRSEYGWPTHALMST